MHEFRLAGVVQFLARGVERLADEARGGVVKDVARKKWNDGTQRPPRCA